MAPPRLDYSHLPKYYPSPPTPEQTAALLERRRVAEATPLERGDQLEWTGPAMHQDALPPLPYPPTASPAANPHRPLLRSLLSSSGPAFSDTPWTLELVEALQNKTEGGNWSQVWRCRAKKVEGSGEAVDVVVKLLHESLFPVPTEGGDFESDMWDWWSAEWLERKEASNYALLNDFQGADIPICYGYYHFDLPHGERVVGLVLEDLSAIARTLGDFLLRARTAKNDELELEDGVDNLFTPALQAVRRFHDRGVVYLEPQSDDILILKGDNMQAGPLSLIFLDLAHTSTRAQAEESIRKANIRSPPIPINSRPQEPRHWRSNDESWIQGLIEVQAGFECGRAWSKLERERGLLGLWRDVWRKQ
ncbi:hypothetical protein BCR35DRAFT_354321 [Leucosporidium creatinivorum]|uniref:Protein kinase domain-containing protein n=1 Tax=Leucosporidium creatinivorum TaxID=106004 RepID=A0A1Y2EN78_9BASI|nr:hypothetical protein BCR35DRAFT_354321 [Leucosporidium creatinivorum]